MNKKWSRVSIAELLHLERRPVNVVADQYYQEIGIYSYGRGIFHKLPRSGLEVGNKSLFLLKKGDLILQITFAWEGAVALCSQAEEGLYGSIRYPTYRVDEEKCLAPFLLRYLCTREGLNQIGRICPGSAGRNRVLALNRLHEILVPIPPLDEQRRILARVEAISQQIEDAQRLRRDCNDDSRSLLAAMAHRADLDDKSKLACGWRKVRLSEVLRLSIDLHDVAADRVYENLGIYSFAKGLFRKPPIDGALTSAHTLQRVREGQFIYSRLFAFEGAYGMVTSEFDGLYTSNEYPTFDCDAQSIRPEFLVAYTLPQQVWKDFAKGSKGLGNRRQRLQPARLLAHELWLPPLSHQDTIVKVYKHMHTLKGDRDRVAVALDALLPAVVDKAFRGDL